MKKVGWVLIVSVLCTHINSVKGQNTEDSIQANPVGLIIKGRQTLVSSTLGFEKKITKHYSIAAFYKNYRLYSEGELTDLVVRIPLIYEFENWRLNWKIPETDLISNFTASDFKPIINSQHINIQVRRYFKNDIDYPLKGVYVGLYADFNKRDYAFNGTGQIWQNDTNRIGNINLSHTYSEQFIVPLGVTGGFQVVSYSGISFDAYFGIGYSFHSSKINFKDQSTTLTDLDNYYLNNSYYTENTKKPSTGLDLKLGLTLGYSLGSGGIKRTIKRGQNLKMRIDSVMLKEPIKKNIIKPKLGVLQATYGISYERYLKRRTAFQLTAAYVSKTRDNSLSFKTTDKPVDSISREYGYLKTGFQFELGTKHYIFAKKIAYPKGFYVSPHFRFNTYNIAFSDSVDRLLVLNFSYKEKVQHYGLGLVTGYQVLFGKVFSAEGYVGIKTDYIKSSKSYNNPYASDLKFKSAGFYETTNDLTHEKTGALFGFRLGFAF